MELLTICVEQNPHFVVEVAATYEEINDLIAIIEGKTDQPTYWTGEQGIYHTSLSRNELLVLVEELARTAPARYQAVSARVKQMDMSVDVLYSEEDIL